jgi:predicted AlkP superfamily pyrophosphatase or phosphodiesterase
MPASGFLPKTDGHLAVSKGAGSAKSLILAIIDGLTPAMLEHGLEERRLPALGLLHEVGTYAQGTTTFPSVTPVCLTSIATGSHPDVHGVPHLVWYHRGERRIVEYGSSFAAVRAAGTRRSIRDSIFAMTHEHLSRDAVTVFEALEDEGLECAAINFTCYRGRTRHALKLPVPAGRNRWYESALGPRRFFFFNLYESDATGAGLAIRSRPEGSIDAYAATIGRWLVTRDGFDFLVFYLPDYDYASHLVGPQGALGALQRADACVGELMAAAGGPEEFLDRYAIVVCSDHGQTNVDRVARLPEALAGTRVFTGRRAEDPTGAEVAVTASNRSGMVYALDGQPARDLAKRLEGSPGVDVVLFREQEEAVARRAGEELRFAPDNGEWRVAGDETLLDEADYPNAFERAWCALDCPNAGEIIVSAAAGWEFEDLGRRHHEGGGSHGSLLAGDSTIPILAAGFENGLPLPQAPSATDLAPLALAHFGVGPPASMRARVRSGV